MVQKWRCDVPECCLQTFSLDCYFRQSWRDERLSFNATGLSVKELSLDWKILTEVWKPDTFFVNGKDSKMHEITVPNRFSRLSPDGQLTFSQRLTIHATCPMKLFKFPLDSQVSIENVKMGLQLYVT